jgi:predicted nucleotide-binding protein
LDFREFPSPISIVFSTLFEIRRMKSEERSYVRTRFAPEVLREAVKMFDQQVNPDGALQPSLSMSVVVEGAQRGHDDEEEFFADYRKSPDSANYVRRFGKASLRLLSRPHTPYSNVRVSVKVQAQRLSQILAVMEVFEAKKQQSMLPVETAKKREPVVFIGHGRSDAWKELRDHLQDKQGFKVEAYEIGARAGHAVRDILKTMLGKASIAFLVMTGEDETVTGELHPRLNVVHEAGLFQGKLGFERSIILLETGVTELSNIHGIDQIRFTNIKETLGDVVATIRREFPNT